MANAADARVSVYGKLGLKPLTTNNVLFYYAPIQGALSYAGLSVNVMNPSLILRLFPRRDITNVLLAHTIIGTGLFLYSRPHLSKLSPRDRILFSSFGAMTFSLGSVLTWAIIRSIVPQNVALCTICGVGSGLALLKIGHKYTAYLDSITKKA